MKLTDAQWEKVKEVIPVRKRPWLKRKRGGRPPVDDRKCIEFASLNSSSEALDAFT